MSSDPTGFCYEPLDDEDAPYTSVTSSALAPMLPPSPPRPPRSPSFGRPEAKGEMGMATEQPNDLGEDEAYTQNMWRTMSKASAPATSSKAPVPAGPPVIHRQPGTAPVTARFTRRLSEQAMIMIESDDASNMP